MNMNLANGAWPTMVTPFDHNQGIDYGALGALTDWYIANGADGLFAACQSSEIFYLSLEERAKLSKFVKEKSSGRVPVVASGHVSYDLHDQAEELNRIAETGVDAVILISNRLAGEDENDDVFLERLDSLLHELPKDVRLGFYECPYPYKRVLTPKILKYCVSTGRFAFLKDTCCDIGQIREKLSILNGSGMRLFNANTATLVESMKYGGAGYSGVMANFQMKLYAWLVKHWKENQRVTDMVQNVLTMCSYIELKNYPANAKCYLNMVGVPMGETARKGSQAAQTATERLELSQMAQLTRVMETKLGIS
jgi:4-hydroxy-tetrahydrodipicolinate synthase